MLITNSIAIDNVVVHINKHTPDKIFNYNTYFKTKYNTEAINILYKVRKKRLGIITSLRAPKHFKVGRQQYNTYRSLVYITVYFRKSILYFNDGADLFDNDDTSEIIIATSEKIAEDLPYTTIGEHTCLKFSFEYSCQFKIL